MRRHGNQIPVATLIRQEHVLVLIDLRDELERQARKFRHQRIGTVITNPRPVAGKYRRTIRHDDAPVAILPLLLADDCELTVRKLEIDILHEHALAIQRGGRRLIQLGKQRRAAGRTHDGTDDLTGGRVDLAFPERTLPAV